MKITHSLASIFLLSLQVQDIMAQYGYSQEIKDYVVQVHNTARTKSLPVETSNMQALVWDDELAQEAQALVNTCVFEHSTNGYGQNLYMGGSQLDQSHFDQVMYGWVQEELAEEPPNAKGYMTNNHASQVLWAKTEKVGCASQVCNGAVYTTCNYFPPGNVDGQPAYTPGAQCSACPGDRQFCVNGLCSATEGPVQTPVTQKPEQTLAPAPTTTAPTPVPTLAPTTKPVILVATPVPSVTPSLRSTKCLTHGDY